MNSFKSVVIALALMVLAGAWSSPGKAVVAGAAPPPADCGYCHEHFDAVNGQYHHFDPFYGSLSVCEPSIDDMGCHDEGAPGGCSGHLICVGGGDDAALEAFRSEDESSLASALTRNSPAVELNTERSSVQLLDCDGHVVSSLPVTEGFLNSFRSPQP